MEGPTPKSLLPLQSRARRPSKHTASLWQSDMEHMTNIDAPLFNRTRVLISDMSGPALRTRRPPPLDPHIDTYLPMFGLVRARRLLDLGKLRVISPLQSDGDGKGFLFNLFMRFLEEFSYV
ncbi:hypothetical protein AVEN_184680-1 [Araneus ventricosus]|uniref:Uncharacterized protein n=1 Tax=Araneus ventricosus TaxID=182803 RepID=A0A4Y2FVA1_ARAVE|nr:hypothetical protein AVEN_184680-1 [Araneus ventricosus]